MFWLFQENLTHLWKCWHRNCHHVPYCSRASSMFLKKLALVAQISHLCLLEIVKLNKFFFSETLRPALKSYQACRNFVFLSNHLTWADIFLQESVLASRFQNRIEIPILSNLAHFYLILHDKNKETTLLTVQTRLLLQNKMVSIFFENTDIEIMRNCLIATKQVVWSWSSWHWWLDYLIFFFWK